MRIPFLLGLLALPQIAAPQESGDERWLFGKLRFGMTTAQARAATPGIEWVVLEGAQDSGAAYSIKASQLLDIGGTRYDIVLGSQYGGTHDWVLKSNATSANAAECDARTAALVADLERRFGIFEVPGEKLMGTEAAVPVGKSSRMKTDAATENFRGISREKAMKNDAPLYYARAKHVSTTDDDVDVMVMTDYKIKPARECGIRVDIQGITPPPEGVNVTFDPKRVVAGPSISYRNRSLRELGVPEKPLEILVLCNMQGSTGKVGFCMNDPDPYRRLASKWALAYRLDTGATDPEDRTMFGIEIPITMGPADVRDVDFENGPVLDPKQVKVVSGDRVSPEGYFPEDPALSKMSADITVRCKVQEDGSVICGLKPGTTSPADAFTRGAILLAEHLEIETTLRDGTSAVGGFIDRRIVFRPAASQ